METIYHLNGQPVEIIARENRSEVWVETTDGLVLRVFKAGLSTNQARPLTLSHLTVDNSRGTDGAR
jgi:hypothetical protein